MRSSTRVRFRGWLADLARILAPSLLLAGTLAGSLAGCQAPGPAHDSPPLVGDVTRGEEVFTKICARCHNPYVLQGHEHLIRNEMGKLRRQMRDVHLTDQQVVDVRAYIAAQ